MNDVTGLDTIAALSREFGANRYVRGGGGNTSFKNGSVLYIKPSGVTLLEMTPERFVGLSREKLHAMADTPFPENETERERSVAAFMAEAVLPEFSGRPSVESPLHNSFPQRFVVHTHPAAVNGMTCGARGAEACRDLFPDALWLPVIKPGYILSMQVRAEMERHLAKHGRAPELVFLANHGVFIAHDEADGVRALYARVMDTLEKVIREAGLDGPPERAAPPSGERVAEEAVAFRAVLGEEGACHAASGRFTVPAGPISPDHIVYCRSRMYTGEAEPGKLQAFRDRWGYAPRVAETGDAVLGLGGSDRVAALALELAWDGAMVVRYAGAFGGIVYLEQPFVDFIEGWEVESYRQRVAQ